MKSKRGENFLSLQCKDSGLYPSLGTKPYYSITQVPLPLSQYKRPSELDTQATFTPSALYLYRSIFTRSHLWPPRPGNATLEWRGNSFYFHVLKVVWENCLRHLRNIASIYKSLSRCYHWNLITKCYLYGWKSSDPLLSPKIILSRIRTPTMDILACLFATYSLFLFRI